MNDFFLCHETKKGKTKHLKNDREMMIVASFQQEYIDVFSNLRERERWELVPETRTY